MAARAGCDSSGRTPKGLSSRFRPMIAVTASMRDIARVVGILSLLFLFAVSVDCYGTGSKDEGYRPSFMSALHTFLFWGQGVLLDESDVSA